MKKFLKNITYFIFPFLIYYFLIYFIDPFNYYNKNIEISRINIIAKDTEPHLYKLIDFKHNPKNNILLGDSRTNGLYGAFGENKIKFWSNLAYGGASLNEMIQTFWHVTNTKKIDSVLIGVNFNHFNSNNTRNWIKPSLRLTENPISYSFSKYVYLSIVSFSKYVYLSIVKFLRKPDTKNKTENKLSKNVRWNNHLKEIDSKYYNKVLFPENYMKELKDISTFCIANNIELIFWIPPVHQDIHDLIKNNGYLQDYNKFVFEIGKLGTLYNFDNDLKLRADKSNFSDAMHLNHINLQNIYTKIFYSSE
jgi:hypothetical protein